MTGHTTHNNTRITMVKSKGNGRGKGKGKKAVISDEERSVPPPQPAPEQLEQLEWVEENPLLCMLNV